MKISIFTSASLNTLENQLNEYLKEVDSSNFLGIKVLYEPMFETEDTSISREWTVFIIEK